MVENPCDMAYQKYRRFYQKYFFISKNFVYNT